MILETERLVIRNWQDTAGDRALFHEIHSDPEVMAFFPRRRTRAESDQMFDAFRGRIAATGIGVYAITLKDEAQPLGFCGLNRPELETILPMDTVEIAWRLKTSAWGKGYVTEAGNALLRHGFETLALPEIVSFAVINNLRSIAVMQRLGMRWVRDFDHPRVPDDTPHLKRHALYTLTADEWRARRGAPTPSAP